MLNALRQTIKSGCSQVRTVHIKRGPNFDPMLQSRDNIPIINKPYYQNKIKKVWRSIRVEETMTYKRWMRKEKKNSSPKAT